jgi:hypothetical protein
MKSKNEYIQSFIIYSFTPFQNTTYNDNDFLLSDLYGRDGNFLPCQKNAGISEENLDVTKWIKFHNMDRHATTPHLCFKRPYIKSQVSCLLAKKCYVKVIHNPFPDT